MKLRTLVWFTFLFAALLTWKCPAQSRRAFFSHTPPVAAGGGDLTWTKLAQGAVTSEPATTNITLTANRHVYVAAAVAFSGSATSPNIAVSDTGGSYTWVQVGSAQEYESRRYVFVYRGTGGAGGAVTLTLDAEWGNGVTFQEMFYTVDEVANADASTPNDAAQQSANTGATSLALADVGTIGTGDHVYAIFARSTADSITAENSAATIASKADGGNIRSYIVFRGTTDDTPSVTWSGSDGAAGIGFIVNKAP